MINSHARYLQEASMDYLSQQDQLLRVDPFAERINADKQCLINRLRKFFACTGAGVVHACTHEWAHACIAKVQFSTYQVTRGHLILKYIS